MVTPVCAYKWDPQKGWIKTGQISPGRLSHPVPGRYFPCLIWNEHIQRYGKFCIILNGNSSGLAMAESIKYFPRLDGYLVNSIIQQFRDITGIPGPAVTLFVANFFGQYWKG